MRVEGGRLEARVAQQGLDPPEVAAALQEMRREGMAQGVGADPLPETGTDRGAPNRPLHDRGVEMPAAAEGGAGVVDQAGPGEEVLPAEVGGRSRGLPGEGVRKRHVTVAPQEVLLVQDEKAREVGLERILEARRDDREPVLLTLAVDDDDRVAIEVEVLDPQVEALGQAETGAVEELADEAKRPLEAAEQGQRLSLAENGRDVPRPPRPAEAEGARQVVEEDLAEEAEHRREGLALRAGRDVLDRDQVGQEGLGLGRAERGRGATGVESKETARQWV